MRPSCKATTPFPLVEFAVRSEAADFLYKCSDYYDADDDCGVLWNDHALGID